MVWTHGPLSFGSTRTHISHRGLGPYQNIYFCSAPFYSIQDPSGISREGRSKSGCHSMFEPRTGGGGMFISPPSHSYPTATDFSSAQPPANARHPSTIGLGIFNLRIQSLHKRRRYSMLSLFYAATATLFVSKVDFLRSML